jgi:hypothetical protein
MVNQMPAARPVFILSIGPCTPTSDCPRVSTDPREPNMGTSAGTFTPLPPRRSPSRPSGSGLRCADMHDANQRYADRHYAKEGNLVDPRGFEPLTF